MLHQVSKGAAIFNAVRPELVEGCMGGAHIVRQPVGWAKRSVPNKKQINTAGGSPAASHFFLRRQEKVTKKKATPVCRPSGSLRCSTGQAAAELALRAQTVLADTP